MQSIELAVTKRSAGSVVLQNPVRTHAYGSRGYPAPSSSCQDV